MFTCDCEQWMRSACLGLGFYKEHEGKRYCVLHYPSKEKSHDFQQVLEQKLVTRDFNFRGVWFPIPVAARETIFETAFDFTRAHFNAPVQFRQVNFAKKTDFSQATFASTVEFKKVTFNDDSDFRLCTFGDTVEFDEVNFKYGQFSKSVFKYGATFQECDFEEGANLSEASFNGKAIFRKVAVKKQAHFYSTEFNKAVEFNNVSFVGAAFFGAATFGDFARFSNDSHSLDFAGTFTSFAHAKFEKPERVSFHNLRLSPGWFSNVDVRKFEFTNIIWMDIYDLYDKTRKHIPDDIALVSRLLAVTYRQLATNAEENHRYEEASNFRHMAMDARRIELRNNWRKNLSNRAWWSENFSTLHLLYWAASGYGEQVQRAFRVLLGIWVLFAVIYYSGNVTWWKVNQAPSTQANPVDQQIDSVAARHMGFSDALIYSAGVMTLQKPEPLPADKWAKAFVLLETVLGPVQAALLALAIRRKFMR